MNRTRGDAVHAARMRRRSFLLAPLLLAVLPAIAGAQSSVSGTIEQVNTADRTIVIRTANGTRSARVTGQTLITIGGMPGDLRDLRPGQPVSAQFAVTQSGAARSELVRLDVRARR